MLLLRCRLAVALFCNATRPTYYVVEVWLANIFPGSFLGALRSVRSAPLRLRTAATCTEIDLRVILEFLILIYINNIV